MRIIRSICIAMILLCLPELSAGDDKEPTVDGRVLGFQLHTLEGDPISHTDSLFSGKVVFFTLWGTFCPPCITEIPTFNALNESYGDSGLVVVGIAFERETDAEARREQVQKFCHKWDVGYLILDGGHLKEFEEKLPSIDNIRGFPVEVLVNRCGEVVDTRHSSGYRKIWAKHLEQRIRAELHTTCDSGQDSVSLNSQNRDH